MTTYRTVVSWLAFVLSAGIGISMGWDVVRSFLYGVRDGMQGRGFHMPSGFPMSDVLPFMAMAVCALAIIAPWLQMLATRYCWFGANHWFTISSAEKLNIGGRWLLSIGLAVLGGPLGLLGGLWFLGTPLGFVFLLVFLIFPEVAQLFSLGPSAFIDAVFFPGGREAKPPYTVKLARFYVKKQRWEDAEDEYARMLSFYPGALEAWEERLALAFLRGANADPEPQKILALAIKALKRPEDQQVIHKRFTRGT